MVPNLLKTLATGGAVLMECKYTLGETFYLTIQLAGYLLTSTKYLTISSLLSPIPTNEPITATTAYPKETTRCNIE